MRGRERDEGRNEEKVERQMIKELSVKVKLSFDMHDKCDVDFIGVSKYLNFLLLKLIDDCYG